MLPFLCLFVCCFLTPFCCCCFVVFFFFVFFCVFVVLVSCSPSLPCPFSPPPLLLFFAALHHVGNTWIYVLIRIRRLVRPASRHVCEKSFNIECYSQIFLFHYWLPSTVIKTITLRHFLPFLWLCPWLSSQGQRTVKPVCLFSFPRSVFNWSAWN